MTDDLSHLRAAPFSLSREQLNWVAETMASMTAAEMVGQVFNLLSKGEDPAERELFKFLKPGGVTRFFSDDAEAERRRLALLQADARIPLLVSADLEGSRLSLPFGTQIPNPIALAAINDVDITREVTAIVAREAKAVGVNWSFSPLLDINAKARSAIVPTRGFGSDPARISRHALAQIEVFQQMGLAATAKHWPGEGHDDRDQHLVTTINPLSMPAWQDSHGRLYRQAIDAGVMSVMSAHIALPAYAEAAGAEGIERFRPASLSRALNLDLLRGELGFGGLVVSDASEMAGVGAYMDVDRSKVELLNAGCDMILFSNDPVHHVATVLDAVRSGEIPAARLSDAVSRILGLKAWLGLQRPQVALPEMPPLSTERVADILARAPVLEKDVQALLPISQQKHRRVLVVAPGIVEPLWNKVLDLKFPQMLRDEGFEVTVFSPDQTIDPTDFDLLIYAFSEEALLTRGRIFLDWSKMGGGLRGAMKRYWHRVPTLMISFGYPYYLYDAPRVPTYINAWATMDAMQAAVVDLILGRAVFNRNSPVDAFDGAPDAIY